MTVRMSLAVLVSIFGAQTAYSDELLRGVANGAFVEAAEINFLSSNGDYFKDTESPNPLRWTQIPLQTSEVPLGGNTVVFADKIWVTWSDNVWSSPDGSNWTLVTDAPGWQARGEAPLLVFDDKIWMLGGQSFPLLSDVWYTSDGMLWTEATPAALWEGRRFPVALVFDNKLWIMGGSDILGWTFNDVWYSEDGTNWVEATDGAPWAGREEAAAVVFNNRMWVSAGWNEAYGVLSDMWSSADGTNWTYEGGGTGHRDGHDIVVYDGRMVMVGGWYAGSPTNRIWYSGNGNIWTEYLPAPPYDYRVGDRVVVFDNRIWVMGNYDDGSDRREVWYAEPSAYHSTDQDQDQTINLSELLRVIQFFNSGGYHCADGTEDGYAPGPGEILGCPTYSCDYNDGADWEVSMTELLRVVQFFNARGYHTCTDGEDGFCPGAE